MSFVLLVAKLRLKLMGIDGFNPVVSLSNRWLRWYTNFTMFTCITC